MFSKARLLCELRAMCNVYGIERTVRLTHTVIGIPSLLSSANELMFIINIRSEKTKIYDSALEL